MSAINQFLLKNDLRIASNPCISPDFCLDWPALEKLLAQGKPLHVWPKSSFKTKEGSWVLAEDLSTGDCAWLLETAGNAVGVKLSEGIAHLSGTLAFPATWKYLLKLKNLIQ
ncbi:MAG: hypothetical protein ABI222_08830, partial [Opitutaceae bacterium]